MDGTARVRAAIECLGLRAEIQVFEASTATAEEAAAAAGCDLGQIVKTLVFVADGRPALVLIAGDQHADSAAIARIFGVTRKRLKMASHDEVLEATGFEVGGVSPLGLAHPCDVIVDRTLERFRTVWVAAGAHNAVVEIETASLVLAIEGQWADIAREVAA
jgi:Cys-tRNA(Pro) deacylase